MAEKRKKKKDEETENSVFREILEYVLTLAGVALAVFLLNSFIIINARIPSESMENTIMKGDQIFGNRLAYISDQPQRYDIAIFRYPDNEKELFIKRVIGLPGETVRISGGKVYINDSAQPLDDSYIMEPAAADPRGDLVFEVPEGHYFMLGDNRNHSKDSRYWKNPYVSEKAILGKAFFRYWPVTRAGRIGYTPGG